MKLLMGTFFHPITIIGPNGEETIEALVDTGSLFAVIPAEALERLGIEADEAKYLGGRRVTQARARLGGHDGWAMCVFGEPGEPARIGRHTLDSFILDIDEEGHLVPKVFHEVRHF
jgi:predicted aspartyl protease